MKKLLLFVSNNKIVLLGVFLGLVLGHLHWYYFGCYWGNYPLSSEWWVNCTFGAVFGGFVTSMFTDTQKTSVGS